MTMSSPKTRRRLPIKPSATSEYTPLTHQIALPPSLFYNHQLPLFSSSTPADANNNNNSSSSHISLFSPTLVSIASSSSSSLPLLFEAIPSSSSSSTTNNNSDENDDDGDENWAILHPNTYQTLFRTMNFSSLEIERLEPLAIITSAPPPTDDDDDDENNKKNTVLEEKTNETSITRRLTLTIVNSSNNKALDHVKQYAKQARMRSLFDKCCLFGENDENCEKKDGEEENFGEMQWLMHSLQAKLMGMNVVNRCVLFVEWMGDCLMLKVQVDDRGDENNGGDARVVTTVDANTRFRIVHGDESSLFVSSTTVEKMNLVEKQKGRNGESFERMTNDFLKDLDSELGGASVHVNSLVHNLDFIFASESYRRFCNVPRCFVVWGLEGTGKTVLKNRLVSEYRKRGVNTVNLSGAQMWATIERGQTVDLEYQLFEQPQNSLGTMICIDDFEMIGGKELVESMQDNTMTYQAFDLIHHLLNVTNTDSSVARAVVVFARNVDAIDASFRAHGRLDKEIYLPVPSVEQRQQIIDIYLNKLTVASEADRQEIAEKLVVVIPGFVGRDIERLCRMASFHSISCNRTMVIWTDFEYALRVVKPSQISDLGVNIPSIPWEQYAGYEDIKRRCKEIMYWPLEYPEAFERHGLPTCSGMLLYGVSGTGKSFLVRCLASLGKMNYISIKCPEIFSKYTGETEEIIRGIFKKARQLEPCVLVFDELDALAGSRELDDGGISDSGASTRALSQLLNEMDGIQSRKNVFLVGCTNRKELIDPAVLRPGRLDQLIEITLPTQQDRVDILHAVQKYGQLNGKPMPMDNQVIESFEEFAQRLHNKTPADIKSVCREAALEALREDKEAEIIRYQHMDIAISSFLSKS